ncbi:unnamed protein product [Pleuronectes platessa]|uniref:Uncharacterized protein n=1 Tax=Pleuronectes platessa TaxID=8262 RepID=A0A9N7YT51_PLEPL|nr:unnamed protein product [Pleuronectes platessa]
MWVVLEPLTHLKAHIVPDDNVIDPLWVICLVRWYQQVMQAIQEDEETGSVIGPWVGMTVQHPMVIHCSTHCDVPTTLAGDLNNGPLANDLSAPSPPLHQVESHLINKDVLHENASYSMDTEVNTVGYMPLSKAPYSPNICSPGVVHGCSLACVSCTSSDATLFGGGCL